MNTLTYILAFALSLNLLPGTEETDAMKDPNAKAILEAMTTQFQEAGAIQTQFTMTLQLEDEVLDEQSGTLYIKGDKFRLEGKEKAIICNNQYIWTWLKEDPQEVMQNNFTEDDLGFAPSQFFTIWQTGFNYTLNEATTINDQEVFVVQLNPEDKEKPFHTIRMWISKKDKTVLQSQVLQKNGNTMTFLLEDMATHQQLEDDFFRFDQKQHPDVELIDLTD